LNNIFIAGDVPGDVVSLNAFEQRFSQTAAVPEPGTLLLLAGGIAGFATFRKKLR
jgi:hypothetical protein